MPTSTQDVAIIGGGIHGVGLAIQLKNAFPSIEFTIIDDEDYLLGRFVRRCNASYTRILRSPIHHQLAPDGSLQLLDFMRLHYKKLNDFERRMVELGQGSNRTLTPGHLFISHSEHLIRRYQIAENVLNAKVIELRGEDERYILSLGSGKEIAAKIVLDCTGGAVCDAPHAIVEMYPSSTSIETGYGDKSPRASDRVHIYGAGMCAAHHALHFANKGAEVTWVSEQPIRFSCTDFPHIFTRVQGFKEWEAREAADRKKGIGPTILPEFFLLLEPHVLNGSIAVVPETSEAMRLMADKVIYCGGLQHQPIPMSTGPNLLSSGLNAISAFGPAAPNIDGVRISTRTLLPKIARELHLTKENRRRFVVRGTTPVGAVQ